MTSSRALYDKLYNYLANNNAYSEIETLNKFYDHYLELYEDNRKLQDELAMLHTIATDSYERRGSTKK